MLGTIIISILLMRKSRHRKVKVRQLRVTWSWDPNPGRLTSGQYEEPNREEEWGGRKA